MSRTKKKKSYLKFLNSITPDGFIKGIEEFRRREKRDAMYKVAIYLLQQFWPKAEYRDIADSLGVLLLTWNQAFYRYGVFNFGSLKDVIEKNWKEINYFRERSLKNSYPIKKEDEERIMKLFEEFLEVLSVTRNGKKRRSPVAAAKALHLLAPHFFPLWDEKIAKVYVGEYLRNPAKKYIDFMEKIKEVIAKIEGFKKDKKFAKELAKYESLSVNLDKKELDERRFSILKLIDEYNYSRITKPWIKEEGCENEWYC